MVTGTRNQTFVCLYSISDKVDVIRTCNGSPILHLMISFTLISKIMREFGSTY